MNITAVADRLVDLITVNRNSEERDESMSARVVNRVDKRVVSLVSPESFEAEQYRRLRYVLEERHRAGKGVVAAVTSPGPQDGKSLTSLNLAASLGQTEGVSVLLIDVDFRRQSASLQKLLGMRVPSGVGLADLISRREASLVEGVQLFSQFNLSVIPAGTKCSGAYELLRSPRFEELLSEARSRFDYVIVDAPPLLPVSDCQVISRHVDGFFLIVTAHRTPKEMLEESFRELDRDKVIGLIFNRGDKPLPRYYGYGYYDYAPPAYRARKRRGA